MVDKELCWHHDEVQECPDHHSHQHAEQEEHVLLSKVLVSPGSLTEPQEWISNETIDEKGDQEPEPRDLCEELAGHHVAVVTEEVVVCILLVSPYGCIVLLEVKPRNQEQQDGHNQR